MTLTEISVLLLSLQDRQPDLFEAIGRAEAYHRLTPMQKLEIEMRVTT